MIRTLFRRVAIVIILPPVDVLLLERFSVKVRPGTQLVQPWQDFLWRPARHWFTDQRIVLLINTGAPVIHQHHHLGTRMTTRTHTQAQTVEKKDPTIFYHCCMSRIRPMEPNTTQQTLLSHISKSKEKRILSSIYTPIYTRTHRHVAKHTVTLLSGSTWTK